jgi:hypothetical protein
MDNGELRRSGEVTNKNYQLRILVFCGCRYSHFSGNSSAFQAGVGSGVIVRRSVTCGYESCCLSGKVFYLLCLRVVTYDYGGYYLSGKGRVEN